MNKMHFRTSVLCCLLFFGGYSFAFGQGKELYLKGNALFIPVGMVNMGVEYKVAHQYTIQADVFISPWKRFLGNHAQVYMGHIEGRYYFREVFSRWYVGGNVGIGIFNLTKWNYLDSEKYQKGFNYMLGATVGYQWRINENWNIDMFLGGGTSQGFYRGYEKKDGSIERYDGATHWNKSGEWIPYRGGVMISYRLFPKTENR